MIPPNVICSQAHTDLARDAARQAITLLVSQRGLRAGIAIPSPSFASTHLPGLSTTQTEIFLSLMRRRLPLPWLALLQMRLLWSVQGWATST